jgi:hypothetical protein
MNDFGKYDVISDFLTLISFSAKFMMISTTFVPFLRFTSFMLNLTSLMRMLTSLLSKLLSFMLSYSINRNLAIIHSL